MRLTSCHVVGSTTLTLSSSELSTKTGDKAEAASGGAKVGAGAGAGVGVGLGAEARGLGGLCALIADVPDNAKHSTLTAANERAANKRKITFTKRTF